ncbi:MULTISPECIES: hypothetical protein [Streptomyces]|uniref:Ig-like domain-containing protein n=1 Tax=Streptomyces fodineus TaxID=1904616 RepID=A0A1D7YD54_9ACTN|nr:hypothetical protein [Streptomyces fodineus]AOR33410.1 hypothetical protein BFF78_22155 [Streptomyces fodineus]
MRKISRGIIAAALTASAFLAVPTMSGAHAATKAPAAPAGDCHLTADTPTYANHTITGYGGRWDCSSDATIIVKLMERHDFRRDRVLDQQRGSGRQIDLHPSYGCEPDSQYRVYSETDGPGDVKVQSPEVTYRCQ